MVFLIVLPPLLYIGAYFTPIRSLRANIGTISSLAFLLLVIVMMPRPGKVVP